MEKEDKNDSNGCIWAVIAVIAAFGWIIVNIAQCSQMLNGDYEYNYDDEDLEPRHTYNTIYPNQYNAESKSFKIIA